MSMMKNFSINEPDIFLLNIVNSKKGGVEGVLIFDIWLALMVYNKEQ